MPTAYQNRTWYRVLVRRLKSLRSLLIIVLLCLLLSCIGIVLYDFAFTSWVQPEVKSAQLEYLLQIGKQLEEQYEGQSLESILKQLPEAVAKADVEFLLISSPEYLAEIQAIQTFVDGLNISIVTTDGIVNGYLHRSQWPFYQRAETLCFIFIAMGFYLPLLVTSIYFLKRYLGKKQQLAVDDAKLSLRMMAHEIKRPLQKMMLAVEMLDEPIQGKNQHDLWSSVQHSVEEISLLVDEALWLARVNHGPLVPQPSHFSVGRLVSKTVKELSTRNDKVTVEVISDGDTPQDFLADQYLFHRALVNLLTNAFRYGGNHVQVSWKWTDQELVFSVQDNGDGIPDNLKAQVLKPFVSGIGMSMARPQGGVGLSIVKSIMDSHSGSVVIADSSLGGVAVMLSWPLVKS